MRTVLGKDAICEAAVVFVAVLIVAVLPERPVAEHGIVNAGIVESAGPEPWERIDRCAIVRLPVIHSIRRRLIVSDHGLVLLPPARV